MRRVISQLWEAEARLRGAVVLGEILFQGRPILSIVRGSEMVFHDGVVIASAPRCNPLGNFQPTVLRTMAAGARLILGPRVGMSAAAVCALRSIEIGEGSILGAGAMVIDNDFHAPVGEFDWGPALPDQARPVLIGRGCFIGARAVILKGVTLGDRVIVGAGAVVTRSAPDGCVLAGNPARIVAPEHLRDDVKKRSSRRKAVADPSESADSGDSDAESGSETPVPKRRRSVVDSETETEAPPQVVERIIERVVVVQQETARPRYIELPPFPEGGG
jgi:acetyltransferase-like isoleucine patch superfamily enzyme